MLLEYEATLHDFAEVHIRLFLRSSTFKKQRVYYALGSAITLLALLFFSRNVDTPTEWSIAIFFAAILATVLFMARKMMVSHSILKYVENEAGDDFPNSIRYTVSEQTLTCNSRDVDITFSLDSLENVVEDDDYLEISFGKRGLCVVPIRAFESDSQKSDFLSAIHGT